MSSVSAKNTIRRYGLKKLVVWLPETHKDNLKDLSDISQSSMGIYAGVLLRNTLDGMTKIAMNIGQQNQNHKKTY